LKAAEKSATPSPPPPPVTSTSVPEAAQQQPEEEVVPVRRMPAHMQAHFLKLLLNYQYLKNLNVHLNLAISMEIANFII